MSDFLSPPFVKQMLTLLNAIKALMLQMCPCFAAASTRQATLCARLFDADGLD